VPNDYCEICKKPKAECTCGNDDGWHVTHALLGFAHGRDALTQALDELERAYPDGRLTNAVCAVGSTLEYLDWCVTNRTEDS
jgi:hypothetical protein